VKGAWTGTGIALGAGLGIIGGLLLLENWFFGPIIGASVGLLIGAIVDAQSADDREE
jgi:hypothetical protein